MKYMGSKRAMLSNGLGEAIEDAVGGAARVFDLFTGSGAVAWHVAERFQKEVVATDLQSFATALAAGVIERAKPLSDEAWLERWISRAESAVGGKKWRHIVKLQDKLAYLIPEEAAKEARSLCNDLPVGSISTAYGGYYLSPWQAGWLDALRTTMPSRGDEKRVALAALIQAASKCVASPGHTAQPFKANATAGKFLIEAWRRDLPAIVLGKVKDLAARHAKVKGTVLEMDANRAALRVREGDLVFLDPPYSGVHYSRFYHVLETVARGNSGPVSGSGRYPLPSERPISDFSIQTKSRKAFDSLLATLATRGATVIVTFPAGLASNGLSGDDVKQLASAHFVIREEKISARFSTMGGNAKHRAARHDTHELILRLSPA